MLWLDYAPLKVGKVISARPEFESDFDAIGKWVFVLPPFSAPSFSICNMSEYPFEQPCNAIEDD